MILARRAFVSLLALAASAPAFAHPPSVLNSDGEKAVVEEIVEFRKALAEAVKAKDFAKLRAMYADSFTHIHTTAKIDGKNARLVSALAGEPLIEAAPADELVIRVHAGGWAATATAISPIKSMADGKNYAVRWSAFFTRGERGWQLAASQATRSHELK